MTPRAVRLTTAILGAALATSANAVDRAGPATQTQPATSPATTQATDPQAAVQAKIVAGIELMEAGKYREAIRTLAGPAVFARIQRDGQLEKTMEDMAGKRGQMLLKALKAAKGQSFKIDERATRAEGKPADDQTPALFFTKVDGECA